MKTNNQVIPEQVKIYNKYFDIIAVMFNVNDANSFMENNKNASVIKIIKNRTQNKEIIILADKNDAGVNLKEKLYSC